MLQSNHVKLELKDSDVEEDIVKILQNLELLRLEAFLRRSVSKRVEKDYLKLTKRLAWDMDDLRQDNKLLKDRLNTIASEINRERLLLKYDPLQDMFWKKKTPCFLKTLDMIIFGFFGTEIDTIDKKHHIVQAMKYFIESSQSKKTKNIHLAPTIFYGAVDISTLVKEIGFKNPFKEIVTMPKDPIILNIGSRPCPDDFEKVTGEAKKLGYVYLRSFVDAKKYLDNKSFYSGYPIESKSAAKHGKVVLENKLQEIKFTNNSNMLSNLHRLLNDIKKKGVPEGKYISDIVAGLIKKDPDYNEKDLSSSSKNIIQDLRKRDITGKCIISKEDISCYSRFEVLYLNENTTYLTSLILEGKLEIGSLFDILTKPGKGDAKLKQILSYQKSNCARLVKFEGDKLIENYEAVK